MFNIKKIGVVTTALTGLFMPHATAQDNQFEEFWNYYGPRMQDSLDKIAIQTDQSPNSIVDFSNIAATSATPQVVEKIIEQEKCALAMDLAESMADDLTTKASLATGTGVPNFDDVLEDAISAINDRSAKIQAICPLVTGP